MRAAIKFGGDESDVRKLVAIFGEERRMIDNEKIDQLIGLLNRIDKEGSLSEFLKNASLPSIEEMSKYGTLIHPSVSDGFEKIHESCMIQLALWLKRIDEAASMMNYFASYCKNMYDGYEANRTLIANPEILKFIRDYEKYYGIKSTLPKPSRTTKKNYKEAYESLKEEE